MSQSPAFDFSKFVPGFDFLQKLANGHPAATPSASSWVAPTLDPQEIERRIKDLRAVQFWLEQNTQAVAATIQALEVQRMTLATLQGMNVSMGELAEALKVQPPAAGTQDHQASRGTRAPNHAKPKTQAKPKAQASDAAASASGVDPMAWWGSLTQQFQQIAGDAMKDMQRKAESMAPAEAGAPSKPSKPTAKATAGKSATRKTTTARNTKK
jgi:hypothetical protein